MKTITKSYTIKAPLEKVWQAFIDPEIIDEWGAGPAVMDDQIGTRFSLWGGDIHGKNIEVEEEERLVQEWVSGTWAEPSIASFSFSGEDEVTQVDLMQENVPDDAYEEVDEAWDEYYLGAIKEYLEN